MAKLVSQLAQVRHYEKGTEVAQVLSITNCKQVSAFNEIIQLHVFLFTYQSKFQSKIVPTRPDIYGGSTHNPHQPSTGTI